MAKYIFQMRRGIKDDTLGINDWVEYENESDCMLPLAGELVLEYDNGTPRLKIGDGVHKFSELSYMSVDSFVLPKPTYIELLSGEGNWAPCECEGFYQDVEVNNYAITKYSKVDLQLNQEQLAEFQVKDITLTTENNNGKVSVICIGETPKNTHIIQAVITELLPLGDGDADTKILGNTIGTPTPCSDWEQTNETKPDFIKNKPNMADYLTKDEAEDSYLRKGSNDDYLTKSEASVTYSTTFVYSGTNEPAKTLGKDGDLYFMYS